MDTINQIILTVYEANQFACAKNPHLQRIALVLLDNVVEVQIRRKSETAFGWDETTWYSGVRKHDSKRRRLVSRYHGELLKLAVEESWITEDDSKLLTYVHRVRNQTYHEGRTEDSTDIQLATILLFRFVRKYFPIWRCVGMLIRIPTEAPASIEEARHDPSGRAPLRFGFEDIDEDDLFWLSYRFDDEDHWSQVLDHCITFDYSLDVRPLIKQRIENLVDKVQRSLDYLTEYDDTDFNAVLTHRFTIMTPFFSENELAGKTMTDPLVALNIYLAVLDSEEHLLDIADPAERATEFHLIVNAHDFQEDILASLDLDRYRRLAEEVTSQTEVAGITTFLKIEAELDNIGRAASECAMDLDGYVQSYG